MKMFGLFVTAMLGSVLADSAVVCDIQCLDTCWDAYQGQETDATFRDFDCLTTTCGCGSFVSEALNAIVDKIYGSSLIQSNQID